MGKRLEIGVGRFGTAGGGVGVVASEGTRGSPGTTVRDFGADVVSLAG